jgi:hypothetical protein
MHVGARVSGTNHQFMRRILTRSIAASFNKGSFTLTGFFAKNVHNAVPQLCQTLLSRATLYDTAQIVKAG